MRYKTVSNLGPSAQGVFLQPRENVGQRYKWCAKKCVFRPIAQIFCWLAPTNSLQFFGHNGLYLQHLSFGGCGLPKILATENMPRITVKLRIVDHSRQRNSVIHSQIATQFDVDKFGLGSRLKSYFRKFSLPSPIIWREKNLKSTSTYQRRSSVGSTYVTWKQVNMWTNDNHMFHPR